MEKLERISEVNMITLWETIQQRRSIRKYVSDDVPDDLIEQMLEAARLAPSGANGQPWRFVVVRDAKVRKEISQILYGQKFIEEAPVVIVCFALLSQHSPEVRKSNWERLTEQGIAQTLSGDLAKPEFWENIASRPIPSREIILMGTVSNCYIAIEHLLLMATALGLGTCWCGATGNARFNQLFGLPDNLVSVAVVPVGYPAGAIPSQRPRLSMEKIVLKPQVQLVKEGTGSR